MCPQSCTASEICISFTDWLHCICQIKAQRAKLQPSTLHFLSFSLICILSFFTSLLSHIFSASIVFPCLTCPSSPFSRLSSLRVEDLLVDPDPTHKRRVDNQLLLSHPGWIGPSSEFPRDPLPSETGLLPIIPHLFSHSSLIFGPSYPHSFSVAVLPRFPTSNQEMDSKQRRQSDVVLISSWWMSSLHFC